MVLERIYCAVQPPRCRKGQCNSDFAKTQVPGGGGNKEFTLTITLLNS